MFHVIHEDGDMVGDNSNVEESEIMAELAQLNADFDNITSGANIDITFCPATRKPDGTPSSGIERHSGSPVSGYSSFGLHISSNELEIKDLSRFDPTQYINVWIVKDITPDPSNGNLGGFASFPGTRIEYDGIVLDYRHLGEKVLTHEVGHYFALYHTFHQSNGASCPPNIDCDSDPSNDATEVCCRVQGDRCCDTDPHIQYFGCPPNSTNGCTNRSLDPVNENHMNYSDSGCRILFTNDQKARIDAVLNTVRSSLTSSLGCTSPCNDLVNGFEVVENLITDPSKETHLFYSNSAGAVTYLWEQNGVPLGNNVDFEAVFGGQGIYEICLTVESITGCQAKVCETIYFFPAICFAPDVCEKVINGQFTDIDYQGMPQPLHIESMNNITAFAVCQWKPFMGSPFAYRVAGKNIIACVGGRTSIEESEALGSLSELNLIPGVEYEVELEYFITTDDGEVGELEIFVDLSNKDNSTIGTTYQNVLNETHIDGAVFHNNIAPTPTPNLNGPVPATTTATSTFVADGVHQYLLMRTGPTNDFLVTLNIVSISLRECPPPCEPNPFFTDEGDICSGFYFYGQDFEEDNTIFSWSVNGQIYPSSIGQNIFNFNPPFNGTFEICLHSTCIDGTSNIYCKDATTNPNCDRCAFEVPSTTVNARKCEGSDELIVEEIVVPINKQSTDCNIPPLYQTNNGSVSEFNYTIDQSDPLLDYIHISIAIDGNNPNENTDFVFSICGSPCFRFVINEVQNCSSCEEINEVIEVDAVCIDQDPNDGTYILEGSFLFNTTPFTGVCGVLSTAGFNGGINVINSSTGSIEIPFEIVTNSTGQISYELNLCLESNGLTDCYSITLIVNNTCVIDPDCIESTNSIQLSCEEVGFDDEIIISGAISITLPTQQGLLQGNQYYLCEENPLVSNNITINQSHIIGNSLILDFEISTTCDDINQGAVLEIYLCDIEGVQHCLEVPFSLSCDSCPEGEDDGLENREKDKSAMFVYPNPAYGIVNVNLPKGRDKSNYKILSSSSQIIMQGELSQNRGHIDCSALTNGLYMVEIYHDGERSFHKLVISK